MRWRIPVTSRMKTMTRDVLVGRRRGLSVGREKRRQLINMVYHSIMVVLDHAV